MSRTGNYNGNVDLINGLRRKNNGDFFLVDSPDVRTGDGISLEDSLEDMIKINDDAGAATKIQITTTNEDVDLVLASQLDATVENFAPAFSASTVYNTGDYVVKDGVLYRFTADHAAGAWTGLDVVVKKLAPVVGDLKDAIQYGHVYPNQTSFVKTLDTMTFQRFSDMPGAVRYTGRYIPANSSTITAVSSRDIVIVNVPYYGFIFNLTANYKVFILSKYSNGEIGTTIEIAEILEGTTVSTNVKQYIINYSAEYYILLDFPSTYIGGYDGYNMFHMPNMSTDVYQDSFRRYQNTVSPTNQFPFNLITYQNKLLTVSGGVAVGGIGSNNSYNTVTFQAPMDIDVTCTNAIRAVIDYIEPGNVKGMGWNVSVVYTSASERVTTFHVNKGLWVAFSFAISVTPDIRSSLISTYSLPNLVNAPDLESAPKLTLTPYQIGKALYYCQTSGNSKYIHMYYPCYTGKYVHYRLQNTPNSNRLVNTWQIGVISGCSFDGVAMTEELDIVENGEFESAMKEAFWDPTGGPNGEGAFVAASDFNGGANHSCEQTTAFVLSIDGELIDDFSTLPTTLTAFSQITAVNVNDLIRVDDHDVTYAEHEKRWTFDGRSAKFDQTITFKVGTYINGWECVMCKAIKNAVNRGSRRDRVGIEDVGVVDPWVNVHTWGNTMAYKYYGDHATVSVEGYCKPHEIDGPPNDHTQTGTTYKNVADLWISNQSKRIDQVDVPYYSKLYYDYWGEATIQKPVQVSAGDTVYSGAEYIVFYK